MSKSIHSVSIWTLFKTLPGHCHQKVHTNAQTTLTDWYIVYHYIWWSQGHKINFKRFFSTKINLANYSHQIDASLTLTATLDGENKTEIENDEYEAKMWNIIVS